MGFNLFVPAMSEDNKTVKDHIVEIMIEGHPLTLRQIENSIKKRYGLSVTYQAIRKAAKLLLKQDVLVMHKKSYRLNKEWINLLLNFVERVKDRSYRDIPFSKRTKDLEEEYRVLHFDRLIDRRIYLDKFEQAVMPKIDPKIITIQMPHGYYTALNQQSIKKRMKLINSHGIDLYRIYSGNSAIDKVSAAIYEDLGAKTKLGVDYGDDSWYSTYGEYTLQTIAPKKVRREEKNYFAYVKKLDESYFNFIEKLYFEENQIKVIIQKNKSLAKRLREQVLSYFGKK